MITFVPEVLVGDPIRWQGLSVFPLFRFGPVDGTGVDYLLSDEALDKGSVTVEEVSESGSVPDLVVDNRTERRVLFLEGEQLVGAKQNRVLNTSVLIAAGTRIRIPVSCVEQGRWRYHSRVFGASDSHSSPKLRHALKASVSASLSEGGGHTSNQMQVWREVQRQQASLGVASETMAMSDTYVKYQERLDDCRRLMPYPDQAVGLAVALGPKVVAIDLFDKPGTCRKVWDRLLSGYALAALEPGESGPAEAAEVERCLDELRSAGWSPVTTVGEGQEERAEPESGAQASRLSLGGHVLHTSLVAAV